MRALVVFLFPAIDCVCGETEGVLECSSLCFLLQIKKQPGICVEVGHIRDDDNYTETSVDYPQKPSHMRAGAVLPSLWARLICKVHLPPLAGL